jgi:hypothetical protein
MALLTAWRAYKQAPAGDEPIVTDADVGCDRKCLATELRDDLKAVGVTRALLFEEDAPNVEPLRFHDLRSTFCTWARRAGKSDAWISERTGHDVSGDMINRYDRGATTLDDLGYAPFPEIAHAVPELAALADTINIVRLATRLATAASEYGSGDPNSEAKSPACPARPGRFELPTPGSVDQCSIQLSYGRSVFVRGGPRRYPPRGLCQRRSALPFPPNPYCANFLVLPRDRDGDASPGHVATTAHPRCGVAGSAQNVNIQGIYT